MPGGCNFDADFCNWTNEVKGDDFNWTRQTGKTPSSKTGPMRDRTGKGTCSKATQNMFLGLRVHDSSIKSKSVVTSEAPYTSINAQ